MACLDIVALQEPAVNPGQGKPSCSRVAGFWPGGNWEGGDPGEDQRIWVGFLVNKKLDTNQWTVEYHSWDLAVLTLELDGRPCQVINTYNEPMASTNENLANNSPLLLLDQVTQRGPTILVGDMNLHHPWWGGTRVQHTHQATWDLISTIQNLGLQLATPEGLVTRSQQGDQDSTLDLTFLL